MGFLEYILGFAAGMSVNRTKIIYKTDTSGIYNSMEEKVDELNMRGVELSEEGYYSEALKYFSKAHNLAPTDLTIKNNILICKRALRKIEEHKKEMEEYRKQQEKEKLQRLRDNASKKPKIVNLDKFPKETESIKHDSNWCNNCCTYIPNDKDYCPYCGSIDIKKKPKIVNWDKFPKETDKSVKHNLNWCNNCCTYIPNDKDYCPYCGSIDIE